MTDWQPIETAPKNDTVILVWDGKHVGSALWYWVDRARTCGYWMASMHGGEANWNDQEGNSPEIEPTHWMPLPDPPSPEGNNTYCEVIEWAPKTVPSKWPKT